MVILLGGLSGLVRIPRRLGHQRDAAPVLFDVFAIFSDLGWFRAPEADLVRLTTCAKSGRYRGTTRTQPMGSLKAVSWFVLPPFKPGSGERESDRSVSRTSVSSSPSRGGKIHVPIELDSRPGRTVFHAVHRNPRATIFWHMDGEYLGETAELHNREARPGPGAHTLTLVDEIGEELVRTFTCLSEK